MFTRTNCAYCRAAREHLEEGDVDFYTTIDLDKVQDGKGDEIEEALGDMYG